MHFIRVELYALLRFYRFYLEALDRDSSGLKWPRFKTPDDFSPVRLYILLIFRSLLFRFKGTMPTAWLYSTHFQSPARLTVLSIVVEPSSQ